MSTANNSKVSFSAKITVTSENDLTVEHSRHTAMFLGVEASILYFGTLIPHEEKYLGISITEKNVKKTDKDTYLLSVSAEINNQEMFDYSALEAYLGTGGNEDEFKMLNNDQKLAHFDQIISASPWIHPWGLADGKCS